jgi:hypothetical protein
MPRGLALALRYLLHAGLIAALLYAALELRVFEEHSETARILTGPLAGRAPGPSDGSYERHERLHIETQAELDALPLVPDLRAEGAYLAPGSETQVLAPEQLRLKLAGTARVGRPLLVELSIRDARVEDALWLEWEGQAPRPIELRMAGERGDASASFELAELAPGRGGFALRWRGVRAGRVGDLRLRYEFETLPPPRVRVGPGVQPDGAFARALRTQGFLVLDSSSRSDAEENPRLARAGQEDSLGAELELRALSAPVEGKLLRDVDRGLGLLLVAKKDEPVDPGLLALLPVVPLPPEQEPEPQTRPQPGESIAKADTPPKDEPPQLGPRAAGDPDRMEEGVRRSGEASDAEQQRALDERTERQVRAAAVVFVIDVSGSMLQGRPSRIELAKKALLASALQLGEEDQLAVVTFGARAEILLGMGPGDRKELLRTRLLGLRAAQSWTNAYPALRLAHEQLKRVAGRDPVRHVLLVTDGEFQDQVEKNYSRLVRQMTREGISISGIGISSESPFSQDPFRFLRKRVVEPTGGRFKEALDPAELPRLLVGEVKLVRKAKTLEEGRSRSEPGTEDPPAKSDPATDRPSEEAEKPEQEPEERPDEKPETDPKTAKEEPVEAPKQELFVVQAEPVLRGLEEHEWPPLVGSLPFESQLRARVHLAVGDQGRVALATAPYGLGRVAVFAGSDGAPWSGRFVEDERFPQLVAQLASWLQRVAPDRQLRLEPVEREFLQGAGRAPGVLEEAAARSGARVVERFPDHAKERRWSEERVPWEWILGLVAGLLGLFAVERVLSRWL